jgi:protein TonB
MSEYLFVDEARQVPTPSRQSSLVAASIVVHAAMLLALLVVSILVPDVLPHPHVAMAWEGPPLVRLADLPLPPPPATARSLPRVGDPAAARAVPLEAPNGIAPEPEHLPAPLALPGLLDGPAETTFGGAVTPVVAPPPTPVQSEPLRLHTGIDPPLKIHDVVPDYPAIARSARAQGIVILEATIDTEGRVVAARVLRSVPLLDDAALQAVRQWQYTPARLNGQPVSVLMTVTVRFALER